MLKKSLLALIVLAILAIPAVADTPEQDKSDTSKKIVDNKLKLKAGGWPVSFEWVNLEGFKIPVYMQVKLYMEILNMQEVIDEGIILDNQISMSKYSGCSIPIKIKSNFDLKLGAKESFTAEGDILGAEKDTLEVRDGDCKDKKEKVPATLCETTAKRTIYFKVKDVDLVHHEFGKKIHIADIQVRVKPDFDAPQWVDP